MYLAVTYLDVPHRATRATVSPVPHSIANGAVASEVEAPDALAQVVTYRVHCSPWCQQTRCLRANLLHLE